MRQGLLDDRNLLWCHAQAPDAKSRKNDGAFLVACHFSADRQRKVKLVGVKNRALDHAQNRKAEFIVQRADGRIFPVDAKNVLGKVVGSQGKEL